MLTLTLFSAVLVTGMLPALSNSEPGEPGNAPTAVQWYEGGYNKALREARKSDSLVFLAFVPDTSNYSKKVVAETFPDEAVAAELSDLVCLIFDNEQDSRFESVRRLFNVETYPTFVIANAKGKIEDRIEGFIPAEPMVEQMQRIKAADGTVGWHRKQVEEEPDDLSHVYSLAQMLDGVRDYKEAKRSYNQIRRVDPKGETAVGARLILNDVWEMVRESGGEDKAQWDLEPVYTHLAEVPSEEAAFQGWTEVGNFYAGQDGRMGDSADAFMHAWEHASEEDSARDWARDVAAFLANQEHGALEDRHGEFAIQLASASVERAQIVCDEYVAENGSTKSEDGGDYNAWVASHVAVLVQCQQAFGSEVDAALAARRCVELDPENEEYGERFEHLLASR
jgi:hypothetical protein